MKRDFSTLFYKGKKIEMKFLLELFFLFLSVATLSLSEELLQVHGPETVLFAGDFNLFSCFGPREKFSDLSWYYEFSNGDLKPVTAIDIAEEEIFSSKDQIEVRRQSFIRIRKDSPKMIALHCNATRVNPWSSYNNEELVQLSVEDAFEPINSIEEPTCKEDPKIILTRWNEEFKSQYWVSHYVTNQDISINGNYTNGLKLTCLSTKKIKWMTTQDLKGFQYWTKGPNEKGCHSAVLVLTPVTSLAVQKYVCGEDKDGSWVDIKIGKMTEDEFNKTQECIEHLGTTVFGNSALTWAASGTSLMSIGMMVGIVFLKKQLNKQKEINGQNA